MNDSNNRPRRLIEPPYIYIESGTSTPTTNTIAIWVILPAYKFDRILSFWFYSQKSRMMGDLTACFTGRTGENQILLQWAIQLIVI